MSQGNNKDIEVEEELELLKQNLREEDAHIALYSHEKGLMDQVSNYSTCERIILFASFSCHTVCHFTKEQNVLYTAKHVCYHKKATL